MNMCVTRANAALLPSTAASVVFRRLNFIAQVCKCAHHATYTTYFKVLLHICFQSPSACLCGEHTLCAGISRAKVAVYMIHRVCVFEVSNWRSQDNFKTAVDSRKQHERFYSP
jgi:hypothetical protein